MTDLHNFRWQAPARLFAGARQVSPDPRPVRPGGQMIPARSSWHALLSLARVLGTGTPFCLHHDPMAALPLSEPGLFFTLSGGTSGRPKVIRRSQGSWIRSFEVNAGLFGLAPSDSTAVLGNLSHSLALYGLLEALHCGLDAHVLEGSSPARQRAAIRANAITLVYATPAQLRLLGHGDGSDTLPSVRLVLCGGGHLDAPSLRRARALFPNAELRLFYGAAETSFISLSGPDTPAGSVGKPYPGVQIELRAAPDGPNVAEGDIWVRSPYLFEGYASGAGKDTHWRDGFVTIGELGRRDRDGNLWISGRRSRLVRIADQNVSPEDIETLISKQSNGALCAVVARPDALRGHHLIACVEGAPDTGTAQRIRATCREILGPLHVPRQVVFKKRLPLLSSGKVDLRALEALL